MEKQEATETQRSAWCVLRQDMMTFLKNHARWLQVPALLLVVGWIYQPAWHGGWLWNDDTEITGNAVVQSPAGLWLTWIEPGAEAGYYPVKSVVAWAQWHLWAERMAGYHFIGLALHVISALLVWRLLRKLGLKFAWLGGLIFAVDPVQVESVAWIAQLKTDLAAPLFLLAMSFYLNFEEHQRRSDYLVALGLFIASLLAGPAAIMFPLVILFHAWWKRGKVDGPDISAATPFFLVALVLGLGEIYFSGKYLEAHYLGVEPGVPGGFLAWLGLAGSSLAFYLAKTLVPTDLMPIYPRWPVAPPSPLDFLPLLAVAGLGYGLWVVRRSWGRHLLLGFGFFVIMLAPFIFIHAAGRADFAWVMDHVLYVPVLGLIGLLVAGIEKLETPLPMPVRIAGAALVAVGLGWMAWQSRVYAATFADAETFWTYALEKNPGAWPAQGNYGKLLLRQGRTAEAVDHLQQAVALNPDFAGFRNDLGAALLRQDRISEAVEQFQSALRLVPDYAQAQANWGAALVRAGQIPEAIEHIQEALRLDPDCAEAHDNWAQALVQSGQFEEAMAQDEEAVRLKPDDADAQVNWGVALAQTGKPWEAMAHDEEALRQQPGLPAAENNWGDALMQAGQADDAISHYRAAVRGMPDCALFHFNLGNALAAAGQAADAVTEYRQVLNLNPHLAAVHDKWGVLLLQQSRGPEAIAHYQAALKLKPDDAEAQDDWGRALAAQGKKPDAFSHYQAAVQANPDFAPAHLDWAEFLFQDGRVEESIPHYLEVVRIEPANAEARVKAGTALAADGRNDEALDQFETALRLKPSADVHDSAGLLLLKLDRKAEALKHFNAALQLNPNDAVAQKNLPPPPVAPTTPPKGKGAAHAAKP
jgi:tetratricopeptide (TPR) repeat protein